MSPPPLHFPAPPPPLSPPCILRGVSVRSDALGVQRSEDLHGPPPQGLRYPDSQHKIEAPLAKGRSPSARSWNPALFYNKEKGRDDGAGEAPAMLDFPFVFLWIDARRSAEQPHGAKR